MKYLTEAKAILETVIPPEDLLPCTHQEVRLIEKEIGASIPEAYKEFLLWIGHGAGGFLRGSDCFYKHLPELPTAATELLQENNFQQPLPRDAFVFFMHQGYQFNFFKFSEGENPPIYFYGEWKGLSSFEKIYPSYSDFLLTEIQDYAKMVGY